MRSTRLLMLLCASVAASGSCGPVTAETVEADPKPVQISVRLETFVLQRDALKGSRRAEVRELLQKGRVAGEAAQNLRPYLAATVASGRATVIDTLTVTTLSGVPVSIKPGRRAATAGLTATILPRLSDSRITADLALSYGAGADSDPTVRDTVAVSDGGSAVVRFEASKDAPTERLFVLKFTRAAP